MAPFHVLPLFFQSISLRRFSKVWVNQIYIFTLVVLTCGATKGAFIIDVTDLVAWGVTEEG